jgi:hypothetical protein
MDLFTSPLEDEEMSLRELAMPSMEDIEIQKSDLTLAVGAARSIPQWSMLSNKIHRVYPGSGRGAVRPAVASSRHCIAQHRGCL